MNVEEAFRWIEQGHQACHEQKWWKAAVSFCQAHQVLYQLSLLQNSKNTVNSNSDETKLQQLYKTQSLEYKQKAQDSFVKALQQQQQQQGGDESNNSLNMSRTELFEQLFVSTNKESSLISINSNNDNDNTSKANLDDLSLRLQTLNASMIPTTKKKTTTLHELNAGLQRLGLKPVSEKKKPEIIVVESDHGKTEHEQVEALLQQVQDHVGVMMNESHVATRWNDQDDDDISMQEQQIIQQVKDEQRFLETDSRDSSGLVSSDDDSSDDNDDMQRQHQFTAESWNETMKHTVTNAQLVLTQIMTLLENETPTDDNFNRTILQTLIRNARSMLKKAEQKASIDDGWE